MDRIAVLCGDIEFAYDVLTYNYNFASMQRVGSTGWQREKVKGAIVDKGKVRTYNMTTIGRNITNKGYVNKVIIGNKLYSVENIIENMENIQVDLLVTLLLEIKMLGNRRTDRLSTLYSNSLRNGARNSLVEMADFEDNVEHEMSIILRSLDAYVNTVREYKTFRGLEERNILVVQNNACMEPYETIGEYCNRNRNWVEITVDDIKDLFERVGIRYMLKLYGELENKFGNNIIIGCDTNMILLDNQLKRFSQSVGWCLRHKSGIKNAIHSDENGVTTIDILGTEMRFNSNDIELNQSFNEREYMATRILGKQKLLNGNDYFEIDADGNIRRLRFNKNRINTSLNGVERSISSKAIDLFELDSSFNKKAVIEISDKIESIEKGFIYASSSMSRLYCLQVIYKGDNPKIRSTILHELMKLRWSGSSNVDIFDLTITFDKVSSTDGLMYIDYISRQGEQVVKLNIPDTAFSDNVVTEKTFLKFIEGNNIENVADTRVVYLENKKESPEGIISGTKIDCDEVGVIRRSKDAYFATHESWCRCENAELQWYKHLAKMFGVYTDKVRMAIERKEKSYNLLRSCLRDIEQIKESLREWQARRGSFVVEDDRLIDKVDGLVDVLRFGRGFQRDKIVELKKILNGKCKDVERCEEIPVIEYAVIRGIRAENDLEKLGIRYISISRGYRGKLVKSKKLKIIAGLSARKVDHIPLYGLDYESIIIDDSDITVGKIIDTVVNRSTHEYFNRRTSKGTLVTRSVGRKQ